MCSYSYSKLAHYLIKTLRGLKASLIYVPFFILPFISASFEYSIVASTIHLERETLNTDTENFYFSCNTPGLSEGNTQEGFNIEPNYIQSRTKTTESESFKTLIHKDLFHTHFRAYRFTSLSSRPHTNTGSKNPVLFHQLLI